MSWCGVSILMYIHPLKQFSAKLLCVSHNVFGLADKTLCFDVARKETVFLLGISFCRKFMY